MQLELPHKVPLTVLFLISRNFISNTLYQVRRIQLWFRSTASRYVFVCKRRARLSCKLRVHFVQVLSEYRSARFLQKLQKGKADPVRLAAASFLERVLCIIGYRTLNIYGNAEGGIYALTRLCSAIMPNTCDLIPQGLAISTRNKAMKNKVD